MEVCGNITDQIQNSIAVAFNHKEVEYFLNFQSWITTESTYILKNEYITTYYIQIEQYPFSHQASFYYSLNSLI